MQTFQKPLTAEEELFYLNQSRQGDLTARNLLVEHNLRLVAHIVKKYNTHERDMEDLISTGTIGLIKAINTYDISKGNKLGTYASRCIENELLMLLRQERKSSKEISLYEPIGSDKEGNEIHLMDIMECTSDDALEQMITEYHMQTVYILLDTVLTPREQEIITLRYGLHNQIPMTQRDVAEQMNISRSYVSRIEKRALEKLRHHLEEG
ncbi:MAG: RNA polymerase sporulation sigma factor SigK [Lachnospiraceae bacterium]|nr:RNA polymerase sporulation sigma factor SigK [Lachnospiraceae bacterium]MBP3507374.1 RNA polymerase sporulation sigma factor SigK [Lachnospiraceae bacterium]